MTQAGDITLLLQQADQGDPDADGRLYTLVLDELKKIARKRKRAAGSGADVSTTILVHDAFLRLVGQDATTWQPGDRRKFFGYISQKMHDLLIDAARKEGAVKRGGEFKQADLDLGVLADVRAPNGTDLTFLLDLKTALAKFQQFARDDAILFRIHYFLGCTVEECAEIMGLSVSAAKRGCKRARLWLQQELKEYRHDA